MRLHGLLCFYDEPVESLVACLAGLARAGTDHVIALDGRYAMYPAEETVSHPNQHAAIHLACRELGMACTLHVPAAPWAGNEPAKRTAHFELAWALAENGDWFWVQDADQIVTEAPDDLKERLAATEHPVGEVLMVDTVAQRLQHRSLPPTFEMRSLFRAQPIKVGPAHCDYVGADGTALWHGHGIGTATEALDLTNVLTVEHRPDRRPTERLLRKHEFYRRRDDSGEERGPCEVCGEHGLKLVAVNWRMSRIGPVAEWREACAEHVDQMEAVSRVELDRLGIDPDSVSIAARNGRIPEPA